jgi:chaperone required for assembly of F1-ATPase
MQISKSVILSYSLMNRMFGFLKFKRLINFENDFQSRKWGITAEQKVINLEIQKNIKNFSIFFNNF